MNDFFLGLFNGLFIGLSIGTPLAIELVYRRQQRIIEATKDCKCGKNK